MTVARAGARIMITGAGRIEDAETLVALLQADRGSLVDLAGATALHTAVVQVLLAFNPQLSGRPDDSFFNEWIVSQVGAPRQYPGIVTEALGVAEAARADEDEPKPVSMSEQT
jgi:hypothetical protein